MKDIIGAMNTVRSAKRELLKAPSVRRAITVQVAERNHRILVNQAIQLRK